jgi:hypothetical protein
MSARVSQWSARRVALWCALWAILPQGGCTDPMAMPVAGLSQIRTGMTRQEVLAILGPPQRQETYAATEFLIYSSDGTSNTALLNFTPVAIVDGRVTGTSRVLYDAVVQASRGGAPGG